MQLTFLHNRAERISISPPIEHQWVYLAPMSACKIQLDNPQHDHICLIHLIYSFENVHVAIQSIPAVLFLNIYKKGQSLLYDGWKNVKDQRT